MQSETTANTPKPQKHSWANALPSMGLPQVLTSALEQAQLPSFADIRRLGDPARVAEKARISLEDAQRLSDHARLALITDDPAVSRRLLEAGVDSINMIARTPVAALSAALPHLDRAAVLALKHRAVAVSAQVHNRISDVAGQVAAQRAGYSFAMGATAAPHTDGAVMSLLTQQQAAITCDACHSVLSPSAYLLDLLGFVYDVFHLDTTTLEQRFLQPWARLTRVNVALASNGASARASSSLLPGFPPSGAINGDRKGLNWEHGGGWNDNTPEVFDDWIQIGFNGNKTIDEIDIFTVQDAYGTPVEPTKDLTFTQFGITNFEVQYWNGVQWMTVGKATGNNKVWTQFGFPPVTTSQIRVLIHGSVDGASRVVEIEAYGQDCDLAEAQIRQGRIAVEVLEAFVLGQGSSACLIGSKQPLGGTQARTFNLTSEGTVDWAHWGLSSSSSFDHKASGPSSFD